MSRTANKANRPLARFLKRARLQAGLQQKDVADHLGYQTAQYVSNWERGLATPPGRTLRKVAQLYGVSAQELYEILLEDRTEHIRRKLRKEFFG